MSSEHSTVSAEELSSSSSPYIKSIRKRGLSPSVVFAIDLLNHNLHHILFLYRASASSFVRRFWKLISQRYMMARCKRRSRVLVGRNPGESCSHQSSDFGQQLSQITFHILQPGKLGRFSWLLRRSSLWSSSACGISERWYCWGGRGFRGMNSVGS